MITIRVQLTSRTFDLKKAVRIIVDEFAEVGDQTARSMLTGTRSAAQLRADGHPYGRSAPSPRARGRRIGPQRGAAPLLPINYQTGDLWRHLYVPRTDTGFTIGFPGTRSAWVLASGGTKNQVARGYANALREKLLPQLRKAAKEVVPKALAREL